MTRRRFDWVPKSTRKKEIGWGDEEEEHDEEEEDEEEEERLLTRRVPHGPRADARTRPNQSSANL